MKLLTDTSNVKPCQTVEGLAGETIRVDECGFIYVTAKQGTKLEDVDICYAELDQMIDPFEAYFY